MNQEGSVHSKVLHEADHKRGGGTSAVGAKILNNNALSRYRTLKLTYFNVSEYFE
jgi:hypothetical protein